MKIVILIFTVLISSFAWAQESDLKFLGAVGGDYRTSETTDGYLQGDVQLNLALGMAAKSYLLVFERGNIEETSGNATLNVTAEYTEYLLWGYYRAPLLNVFEPFIGAGVGVYNIKVESNLGGATSTSTSDNKFTSGLAMGIRPVVDPLWLSVEIRVRTGEDFNPNPALSILGRIGLYF